jgi:hypothetical protein
MPAAWDRLLTAGRAPKLGLPGLFARDLKPAIRKASGFRREWGREQTVGCWKSAHGKRTLGKRPREPARNIGDSAGKDW